MCYACHCAVHNVFGVVHGVPVDIMKLGPNLEAYSKNKKRLTTLRLCNRFGQDPDAHITKIPVEIIDMIEEYVLIPARKEAWAQWEIDRSCYSNACDYEDHYDEDELFEMREEICAMHGCCNRPLLEDEDDYDIDIDHECCEHIDEMVAECLSDEPPYHQHERRKNSWEERVSQRHLRPCKGNHHISDKLEGFSPLDQILNTEFGLQSLLSKQVIPQSMINFVDDADESFYFDPPCTTIAYLILPCILGSGHVKFDYEHEYEDRYESAAVECSILDTKSLILTDEDRRRFKRAMKRLDLAPYVHPTQLHQRISAKSEKKSIQPLQLSPPYQRGKQVKDVDEIEAVLESIEKRVKELEQSDWPKLMNIHAGNYSF